jgi:tetraacyldisaccharide 4'-kinase
VLERIWKKIIRRKPYSLWTFPALLLWVCSFGYRLFYWIHRSRATPAIRLEVPVISIGNITVGGTGKTPLVELLARSFLDDGFRVGIVSSGYGRPSQVSFMEPGYKMQKRSADETGDEVQLLAELLPEAIFSVDRSKSAAARRLDDSGSVDLMIIDDGFQHFSLARDLDIVTYDAAVSRRILKLFPYGVLREPLSALKRAGIIIITRSNFTRDRGLLQRKLKQINPDAAYYYAPFIVDELVGHNRRLSIKYLEDKSVFLFAGVGNFGPLRKQVAALSGDLVYALELSDHQQYNRRLLSKIKLLANKFDSDVIITTGKDWVKLGGFDFGREIYYLAQSIDLDPGEEKLVVHLHHKLNLRRQHH